MERDTEALRRELLDEAYAGAFSGLGAMLLDADEIRNVAPGNWRKLHGGMGKGEQNLTGGLL